MASGHQCSRLCHLLEESSPITRTRAVTVTVTQTLTQTLTLTLSPILTLALTPTLTQTLTLTYQESSSVQCMSEAALSSDEVRDAETRRWRALQSVLSLQSLFGSAATADAPDVVSPYPNPNPNPDPNPNPNP